MEDAAGAMPADIFPGMEDTILNGQKVIQRYAGDRNPDLGNYLGALKNWSHSVMSMSAFTAWWICIPSPCVRIRRN